MRLLIAIIQATAAVVLATLGWLLLFTADGSAAIVTVGLVALGCAFVLGYVALARRQDDADA